MRIQLSLIIGLVLASSTPATAAITAGATVKDTSGGVVGTITRVEGGNLVLKTDRHDVTLPVSSFTATDEGALFGMTRDQLNAEVDCSYIHGINVFPAGAFIALSSDGSCTVTDLGTADEINRTP